MYLMQSDYLEGCHPAVMERLLQTNLEQCPGYGEDVHCENAARMIRERFSCPEAAVHFLVGGTQVNTVVINAALRPFEGVLCAHTGHINVHETGAIEATGHKCLALPGKNGKITGDQIREAVELQADDEHMVKPGMVYISQSTELGTLYTLQELRDIFAACREKGLLLYVDGARLGYAMGSGANDISPADLVSCCDAFTVGGTKVGALFGEALVILNPAVNRSFRYMMKQHGALLAKGRLLGVQFEALMENDLYFTIGRQAVEYAMQIRQALKDKGIPFLIDSPTNQLFPIFNREQLAALSDGFTFMVQEKLENGYTAVRICTSWATTREQTDTLIQAIRAL